ncbi:hypothetical protein T439DRAFT_351446 [Meredithblackwellia eburnea MCA 4105]
MAEQSRSSQLKDLFEGEQDEQLVDGINSLESINIKSGLALLLTESPPPHPSLPFSVLSELKSRTATLLSAKPISGADLLLNLQSPQLNTSTTLEQLDLLISASGDGGWPLGSINEISGPPGSFKTLLALSGVLSSLLTGSDTRALWVDTSASFNPNRCMKILEFFVKSYEWKWEDGEVGVNIRRGKKLELRLYDVLDRLEVTRTSESDAVIRTVEFQIHAQGVGRLQWIVLDSVTDIFGGAGIDAAKGKSDRKHAGLTSFVRKLEDLAQAHHLIVLAINSTVPIQHTRPFSRFPTSGISHQTLLKPALGNTFTYLTEVSVWMTKAEQIWDHRDRQNSRPTGVIEVDGIEMLAMFRPDE